MEIDRIVANLPIGHVAYNTPKTLDRDENAFIELLLSPRQSIKQLKERLSGAGQRVGASVKISDEMEATLTSPDFDITVIGGSVHLVTGTDVTKWAWVIRPRRTGVLHLYLSLTANVDVNGKSKPLEIRTFTRTLTVRVGWAAKVRDFVQGNWQWLWTSVLVPVALWGFRKRRRRRVPPRRRRRSPPRQRRRASSR